MKLTKMAIALALTTTATMAHAIDATDVTLSTGQDIETTILNEIGRVDGLSNDMYGVMQKNDAQDTAITNTQADLDASKQAFTSALTNKADVSALGNEITSRADADTAINNRIDSTNLDLLGEVNTRQAADNVLAGAIKDNTDTITLNEQTQQQWNQNESQARNDMYTDLDTRKLDKSAYDTDKAAQDGVNADHDSRITANTNALTGKVDTSAYATDKAATDSTLADHDQRITSNTTAISTETTQREQGDAQLDSKISTETSTRTSQFNTLTAGVAQAQSTGEYAQSRADAAFANAAANKQALDNTNKRVSQNTADIANHEQRITSLESQTNSKFADLNKQVDDNRKRASAGIAGVAAMANIPQVTQNQSFSIGAGVGNTDGENALAVGMSARAGQSVVVKASVSNDTQHNFVVGAGVSYGW